MSPRGGQALVQDILDACNEILAFTTGMDYESFSQDLKTIRAVELNFIIIGEAAGGIPEEIKEAHPEVPWHYMRAMRNRLVHVYFEVDPRLVWDTVRNDIPSLIRTLKSLLQDQ
jgi:uncharacterized protein with HEPN domain